MNDQSNSLLTLHAEVSADDKQHVFRSLYQYNVAATQCLLQKPGIDIQFVLKDEGGNPVGGIFCDTFLYCLYIDVLWIDERYRGLGYGKVLIRQAEKVAREKGCTFAHTCTFSYQSPDFYQAMGYDVFATLADYPNGIKQFFLKKALLPDSPPAREAETVS